jgi:hypothetical protein
MHPLLVDRPVILKEYEIRCDNCDKKIGVMVCTSQEYPKNVAIFSCNKCKPDMKWLSIVYHPTLPERNVS